MIQTRVNKTDDTKIQITAEDMKGGLANYNFKKFKMGALELFIKIALVGYFLLF